MTAVVVISPSGEAVARRVAEALGAPLHGRASRVAAEVIFDDTAEHLRTLFAAGVPIVAVAAAGILVRALAPMLGDKREEPPVVAVAEDGSVAVPLLGGHRGANALAGRVAAALGCPAAVTTAGEVSLGLALDAPPPGWRLANPEDARAAMAALLAGAELRFVGERVFGEGDARSSTAIDGGGSDHADVPDLVWHGSSARSGARAGGQVDGLVDVSRGRQPRRVRDGGRGAPDARQPASSGQTPMTMQAGTPLTRDIEAEASGTALLRAAVDVVGTEAPARGGTGSLVYHPQRFVLGLGSARGADSGEMRGLVERVLREAGVAPGAVAAVATIALKADEPAILGVARWLGVPIRLFAAAELEALTPRLATPSDVVFAEVGCHGVAEAAALAAAGPDAVLALPKRKSGAATAALARALEPVLRPGGKPRGHLAIVGIGPGQAAWRTPEASRLVAEAEELVGYGLYLDLLGPLAAGKARSAFPLGGEAERCRYALERAGEGRRVALVSSGDAGIYAMGALVFELLDRGELSDAARRVEVVTAPGISALQAAAARAGAPLGHDFCAISLSDLLTPRETILRRVRAAAEGDFVVAFYNPVSARRRTLLAEARDLLLGHRPGETPVLLATSLGRTEEMVRLRRLDALSVEEVDMLTVVIVGSSESRVLQLGQGPRIYTPRGYAAKLSE